MADWDLRFLHLAEHIKTWSKDPHTQVGAVIVDSTNRIVSIGYNGFPSEVDDDKTWRYERPQKYLYTEHAERNAIYNAHRTNASPIGGTIYTTLMTCADCARAIIQCGIKKVCTWEFNKVPERYTESFAAALEMFDEADVNVVFIPQQ
jgi:dCMP deaminase